MTDLNKGLFYMILVE